MFTLFMFVSSCAVPHTCISYGGTLHMKIGNETTQTHVCIMIDGVVYM